MIVSFLTTYIFIINYYRYEVNIFSSTTIFCVFGYLERAYTDGSDAEKAQAFIAAIRELNGKLGIPGGFDFIKPKDIRTIAK